MVLLEEGHELLADFAAQIPGQRRIGRAHERADLQGVLLRIGDLHDVDLPVPA